MEKFFVKLQEYLQMDEEISYEEFSNYYKEILKFQQENFEQIDKDGSIKGRYIMNILALNASDRSKRKTASAKKYKKILDKCQFWAEAFNYRLLKLGMTQGEIDKTHEELNEKK